MIWASIAVLALIEAVAPELTVEVRSAFATGLSGNPIASFIDFEGRPFPFRNTRNTRNARTVARVLQALSAQAEPGERLFVGPGDLRRTNYNDTYFYHLLPKLTPATYFLEMKPLSANRPGSRLASDVASADWLVLNRGWDAWNEPNRSVEFASNEPNEVVRRNFELVQGFGTYFLYRRVDRVAPVVARQ